MGALGAENGDTMTTIYLTATGGAVKAKRTGEVEGYLVLFGGRDIDGDYFTKETDFGFDGAAELKSKMYYEHGWGRYRRKRIGDAVLSKDDTGVYMKGKLTLPDDEIAKIADEDLGLSSGSVWHLVERKDGVKRGEITYWPLGLDASLTKTPSDRRTADYLAIKSVELPDDEPDEPEAEPEAAQAAAQAVTTGGIAQPNDEVLINEVIIMADNGSAVDVTAELTGVKSDLAEIKSMFQALKSEPPKMNGVVVPAEVKAHADGKTKYDAFKSYVQFGFSRTPDGLKAALNQTTGSEGGYLVPEQFSNEIVKLLTEQSILRTIPGVRIYTVMGTNVVNMPTLTNSARSTKTAESGAFGQKEPTFGNLVFSPTKYTQLSKVSDEVLRNARIPLEQLLSEDAAQAFAAGENEDFTTGDGSGDPQGIVVGSAKGADAADNTTIAADDIINLFYGLNHLYRRNAVWMMNDTTAKAIRSLKDTTNRYIWESGLQLGQPDLLMGRPVYTNNSMAEIGNSAKSVLFFDPRYYAITDFDGMEVKRLDELYAANGQVGFQWYKQYDGRVRNSAGVKHLLQAAS